MKIAACVFLLAGCWGPFMAQDSEELEGILRKAGGYTSYRFTVELDIEGLPNPIDPIPRFEGTFETGKGMHYAVGVEGQVARRDDRLAVQALGGEWKSIDEIAAELPSRPSVRIILETVRALRPPHELLLKAETALARVAKSRENEEDVFTGPLTERAARKSVIFRREVQKLQDPEITGLLRIRTGAEGRVTGAVLEQRVRGSKDGSPIDVTLKWTFTITDVGAAKSEMPEDAERLLESR